MKNLLLLSILFFVLPAAGYGQEAAAPEYRDGDTWQYNAIERDQITTSTRALNGDFKVVFKGGEVRIVPVAGQEKSGFKQSIGEMRRLLAVAREEKYLEFPLSVNKKWSAEFKDEVRGGIHVETHAEVQVSGYEEVDTAAGKFKAFKIERYETSGGSSKGRNAVSKVRRVEYTYYYSPDTRSVVKLHRLDANGSARDLELTSYTPAR